ncbi:hypothetical protein A3J43_04215 [Candidatus Uhrbacteria bacterium RIFCSPHIGHO2_12_FULL_54_23]|uniref:3-oxoacyl-ACP synthase n=3 Tax=Candidatus Uhriibacteriota TaxID=1752732 RepID=A0A1F7UFJ0_9BACT|nr:MAG: hypothetical protein UY79_C0006G0012 [Parcubacteria group bacterium GW2011_GWA2_53_21]OGL77033.1 MAG: hypothetical protein A3J43_04215 [Candidatus Uhrbacteria bacterium RIFCSPHIGHO2_12_FULL_54_23]OGL85572.1 MAG: hypothetical protein A3B36_00400 [Candidatus Uhrbacteria bacterium RIFCSPLOWO2_01_FULL_55_36]OGL89576.1 MAG: hypothetical protein A3J36_02780 [Candidatus Uhrbacteria bacterium RIFCSPLOWO2_02_FULL_54_37]
MSHSTPIKKLRNIRDEAIDFSDIPEVDEEWFQRARVVFPQSKTPVSLRLDRDVVSWFKTQGKGYQTHINAVLKGYVEAQRGEKAAQ